MCEGFPGGSDGKESAFNAGDSASKAGDLGSIPGLGRSTGGGHGNPLQYSCPGESPWTEDPGGPQSIGSQRVEHDWAASSVQFSCSVMSDSLQPHGLQHTRLPCPWPTPRACSNSCPSSWWCHPTVPSSVIPFSCLQSFPVSGSFPMSQFFTSGGQSIGASASASVLPMNIQDWFPLGLADLISFQSKGFPRFFSNTTVQKHQFFSTKLS